MASTAILLVFACVGLALAEGDLSSLDSDNLAFSEFVPDVYGHKVGPHVPDTYGHSVPETYGYNVPDTYAHQLPGSYGPNVPETYGAKAPESYGYNADAYRKPRPFGFLFLGQPVDHVPSYGYGKPEFVQLK
uniref:Secreted protein n=1 Tax=Steinernema glaseri TaxID=37863 RepID=A0A1I7YEH7_9BILA